MPSKITKIGIVGSGAIGQALGVIFGSHEIAVKFYDARFQTDVDYIAKVNSSLHQKFAEISNVQNANEISNLANCFTFCASLAECVAGSDLVYECVFEDAEVKRKVLLEIDAVADPCTIMTSSSSCIMPSVLSDGLKNRHNFLVTHPVNPPFYLQLVEVVPAPWTKPEILSRVRDLMIEVGQKPICLKREVPGFALNRVQYSIINSCWDLVEQGIVAPSDIDDLFAYALGPRYAVIGPFQTMHLNAPNGVRDYMARYEEGMRKVSMDIGQNPQYDSKTFEEIATYLESRCPVEKLKEAIANRDAALKQINKIKTD